MWETAIISIACRGWRPRQSCFFAVKFNTLILIFWIRKEKHINGIRCAFQYRLQNLDNNVCRILSCIKSIPAILQPQVNSIISWFCFVVFLNNYFHPSFLFLHVQLFMGTFTEIMKVHGLEQLKQRLSHFFSRVSWIHVICFISCECH